MLFFFVGVPTQIKIISDLATESFKLVENFNIERWLSYVIIDCIALPIVLISLIIYYTSFINRAKFSLVSSETVLCVEFS